MNRTGCEVRRGIATKDISLRYNGQQVLRNVSLTLKSAEVTTLLGPNGCGKTTLLKIMNGLLRPDQGSVCIAGHDVTSLKSWELARLIGYVPQTQRASFPFLAKDIVLTGRMPHISPLSMPGQEDLKKAFHALSLVGASHLASRPYTRMSGGERQLIMIARALAQEPSLLLLDEPTSYLDFRNQIKILKMISGLAEEGKLTVVMTLHDPNHALMFSDEVVLMRKLEGVRDEDGKDSVVAAGRSADVMNNRNIFKAYGVDVEILEVKGRKLLLPL